MISLELTNSGCPTLLRFVITGTAMVILVSACGGSDHEHTKSMTGEQLFEYHCAGCHQEAGEGAFLRGVPPVKYTKLTYKQLVDQIRGHNRREGSRMPKFETMQRAEAEKIAIYIRRKLRLRTR